MVVIQMTNMVGMIGINRWQRSAGRQQQALTGQKFHLFVQLFTLLTHIFLLGFDLLLQLELLCPHLGEFLLLLLLLALPGGLFLLLLVLQVAQLLQLILVRVST